MENIHYPLDFPTISDIVMQTDYVLYLDFALAFGEMLDAELITPAGTNEHGETLYAVSEKGRVVASELHSDILPSLLDKSLESALRYLNFQKRGIRVECSYQPGEGGNYWVDYSLFEEKERIFHIQVKVDSLDRAKRIKQNIDERPEAIFRGTLALLSGKMNYLFD